MAIQGEWDNELHQIGNLMILEMKHNRSISNEDYVLAKLPVYAKSQFQIVQKHARDFPKWDLNACKTRKNREVRKLVSYLCGNDLILTKSGQTNNPIT